MPQLFGLILVAVAGYAVWRWVGDMQKQVSSKLEKAEKKSAAKPIPLEADKDGVFRPTGKDDA